ncbi:MAG: ASCH domain-containing protein [Puniceicoccales bacterium]|nr:ASCH domain-containing protein [Puniceicoccales bacterium]
MPADFPLRKFSRWTPSLAALPALSIRQPFAWMIVHGFKDIENRTWNTRFRRPFLIHAASMPDTLYDEDIALIEKQTGAKFPAELTTDDAPTGGIVGVAEIVDCVKEHPSSWKFPDTWGFVLANARPLPFRACKGKRATWTC